MTTLLMDGNRLTVLGESESVLRFRTITEALDFLRPLAKNRSQMAILRQAIGPAYSPPSDPAQELETLASLLVDCRLKIIPLHPVRRRGATDGVEEGGESKPDSTQSASKAPAKTAWIEIYLHDADGRPVKGERYRIKLPDGSIQEGILDAFGHAEYYEINPGNCEVSFPDRHGDGWAPIR